MTVLLGSIFVQDVNASTSELAPIHEPLSSTLFDRTSSDQVNGTNIPFIDYDKVHKVGGPIPPPSDIVMFEVESDQPYYLRANVFDQYYDSTWNQTLSSLYPLGGQQIWHPVGNGSTENLKILLVHDSGAVIFAPLYPTIVDYSQPMMYDDYLIVKTTNPIPSGSSYLVRAFLINPSEEDLRSSRSDYPQDIVATYLQLPENLDTRIVELGENMTAKFDNPYEKAKAIQGYLQTNYEYALNVSHTPEGMDLVDFFLFDLREGYCEYFATSMVILSRVTGIPARYVVGYAPGAYNSTTEAYDYKASNAHAWAELYFSGIGWIVFDATPTGLAPAIPIQPEKSETANIEPQSFSYLPILACLGGGVSVMPIFYFIFFRKYKKSRGPLVEPEISAAMRSETKLAVEKPPRQHIIEAYLSVKEELVQHDVPLYGKDTHWDYYHTVCQSFPEISKQMYDVTLLFEEAYYSDHEISEAKSSLAGVYSEQIKGFLGE